MGRSTHTQSLAVIHRYRIFQFCPKMNVRHPKSPNVRPNSNIREGFVFARTFGHFTERLAILVSKVLPPAVGPSQFMHFQCQNGQTFGKMAEHTAKMNVLLINETQISMPNLRSDECMAQVRPEPSARKPFRCITALVPGNCTSKLLHGAFGSLKVTQKLEIAELTQLWDRNSFHSFGGAL